MSCTPSVTLVRTTALGLLFSNVRGTRIKSLVHDGVGVWCAARRLDAGRFVWPSESSTATPTVLTAQLRSADGPSNSSEIVSLGNGRAATRVPAMLSPI
ncbi:IS66 family insertion sequence element accessory protein TnpB [Variovorax paradoxus]|uniref:IS66 family insertion sequence element accessory protein TnpB n=1 Tax=Variovorax paradoxus TaxID=34073 RepID=UPI003D646F2E